MLQWVVMIDISIIDEGFLNYISFIHTNIERQTEREREKKKERDDYWREKEICILYIKFFIFCIYIYFFVLKI